MNDIVAKVLIKGAVMKDKHDAGFDVSYPVQKSTNEYLFAVTMYDIDSSALFANDYYRALGWLTFNNSNN